MLNIFWDITRWDPLYQHSSVFKCCTTSHFNSASSQSQSYNHHPSQPHNYIQRPTVGHKYNKPNPTPITTCIYRPKALTYCAFCLTLYCTVWTDMFVYGYITLFGSMCCIKACDLMPVVVLMVLSVVVKLLGLFGEERQRCSYWRVYFCAGGFSSQVMSCTRRDVLTVRKPSEDREEVMDPGSTPDGILNFR